MKDVEEHDEEEGRVKLQGAGGDVANGLSTLASFKKRTMYRREMFRDFLEDLNK